MLVSSMSFHASQFSSYLLRIRFSIVQMILIVEKHMSNRSRLSSGATGLSSSRAYIRWLVPVEISQDLCTVNVL